MNLDFAHAFVHLAWITVDASDERVPVLFIGRAIVVIRHYDSLAACVPATEDQHDFARFHNLTHLAVT